MGARFRGMAFLGIVAPVGVIVSHVIALFDIIEEMRARGEPRSRRILDAGRRGNGGRGRLTRPG